MFAAMLKDTNEADRLKRSAEQRDRMQEIIDNIEAKSEGTRAEHTAGIETVEQTTRLGSVQDDAKGSDDPMYLASYGGADHKDTTR